ncbi:hypothetical protein, partial [Nitratireductor rhodophyticola]
GANQTALEFHVLTSSQSSKCGSGSFAEGQRSLPHPQEKKSSRFRAPFLSLTLLMGAPGSTAITRQAPLTVVYPEWLLHK